MMTYAQLRDVAMRGGMVRWDYSGKVEVLSLVVDRDVRWNAFNGVPSHWRNTRAVLREMVARHRVILAAPALFPRVVHRIHKGGPSKAFHCSRVLRDQMVAVGDCL